LHASAAHSTTVRYFAYASNMAERVMNELCPGHRCLGAAELPEYRLAFTRRSIRTNTGVADVVHAPGHSVWGVLYELDEAMLAAIDAKEGNGWAYQRREVRVRADAAGPLLEAQTYAVIAPEEVEVAPSLEYLQGVLDAAELRGLPEDYVAALAGAFA
jgi:gamma-glutamylcyclotransferase (GGCT)/AIG2-like uncharacterized protein YtfP